MGTCRQTKWDKCPCLFPYITSHPFTRLMTHFLIHETRREEIFTTSSKRLFLFQQKASLVFIRLCIRLRRLNFLELCACNWILERKTNIFFSQKICSICSATLTNVKGGNLNKKVGLVGSCHNFFLQKSKRKKD
jgi:hypothetical protein